MQNGIRFGRKHCTKTEQWLEGIAIAQGEIPTAESLLASLGAAEQEHIHLCGVCQNAVRDFLESRILLNAVRPGRLEDHPFFAKRVMAAIASREGELERASRAWAVVPRLAARFAGVATVLLLIGGAWVYEGPLHNRPSGEPAPAVQPAAESGSQLFEDNAAVPANRDEVLVSLLERGQ